jgi:hypothetical protein
MNADQSGQFIDTLLDLFSILYDLYDISIHGLTSENYWSLVLDTTFLFVPFATGGGLAVRALSHGDEVYDAARALGFVDDSPELPLTAMRLSIRPDILIMLLVNSTTRIILLTM